MIFMTIVRLADALKDSFNMPIERLDILYSKTKFTYCGYLTLKENDRIIEFEIYSNGEIIRISSEECDANV